MTEKIIEEILASQIQSWTEKWFYQKAENLTIKTCFDAKPI
jgi:hypothetical protein